jgi:predicted secreted hydrolase
VNRRRFLGGALALAAAGAWAGDDYPSVTGRPLVFPRDHGSHPGYRTEWWYVTGWVAAGAGRDYGIQVTFFRHRPRIAEQSPSAFAPKQLLFAHAALADPTLGRLRHDQRAARAGFGLAEAATATTDVVIDDWSLALAGDAYRARVVARDFALDLRFTAREPPLLNGESGVSRKGPAAEQASYYYSRPHLAVTGKITADGNEMAVTGVAWLDHEWSSEYIAAAASGWDWTGINFADGGALMAFRMRNRAGGALWAGGTRRDAGGRVQTFGPGDVRFTSSRTWRSPRTGFDYPVAMTVTAGGVDYNLAPLIDDQELDSRASTGTVYWEGAVRAAGSDGSAGRGYLELTGYGTPLRW